MVRADRCLVGVAKQQVGLIGGGIFADRLHRQFREALEWFKQAIARGGDAMVAHGLAHTLRELNMMREAEEVAYAWRERFVGNELLFIDLLERKLTLANPPFIEPVRIERYARVVNATASGEGAQGLAWYAYNSCQFDTALEWFQRAVAWMPSEGSVFGYALTLQRLKRQRPFLEVVNRYDGLFPRVVDLLFQSAAARPMPCEAPVTKTVGRRVFDAVAIGFLPVKVYAERRIFTGLAGTTIAIRGKRRMRNHKSGNNQRGAKPANNTLL